MSQATVIYDGVCGFCEMARKVAMSLDWLNTMRWIPLQSAEAVSTVDREQLLQRLHLIWQGRVLNGYRACKAMAWRLPVFWMIVAVSLWLTWWMAAVWLVFFSPILDGLGNRAYDWVARHRYLLPGSKCSLPY